MPGIIENVKGFFLGNEHKEPTSETNTSSTDADPVPSSQSNEADLEVSPHSGRGIKRQRGVTSDPQQGRANKRVDTGRFDEREGDDLYELREEPRSLGDPRRSHADIVPTTYSAYKMSSSKVYGGHRPMNTLNSNRHVKAPTPARTFMGGNNPMRKPANPSLSLQSSKGHNVRPASVLSGDGFRDEPVRNVKRQKLGNGASSSQPASSPVDLTLDDSQQDDAPSRIVGDSQQDDPLPDKVITVNGRPTWTPTDCQKVKVSAPFYNSEFKTVDDKTSAPKKRARKSRDGGRSSQESSRATPLNVPSSRTINEQQQNRKTTVVIMDDDSQEACVLPSLKQPKADRGSHAPKIDLWKGVEEITKPTTKAGSREDVVRSGEVLQAAVTRTHNEEMAKQRGKREVVSQRKERRTIEQEDQKFDWSNHRNLQEGMSSPRLADNFVRDTPEAPKDDPRRASQRMQASSRTPKRKASPTAGDISSEDELARVDNTMTRASHSGSPRKHSETNVEAKQRVAAELQPRQPSPGHLEPTHASEGKRARKGRKAAAATADDEVHTSDNIRIPINHILCRSCCLVEGGIELVWDPDSLGFLVCRNDEFQIVPSKSSFVCIGTSEARTWVEIQSRSDPTVQIKGSITPNSNSSIIIQFMDVDGLNLCFDTLLYATGDRLAIKHISADSMRSIVKNQVPLLQEDFQKHRRINARAAAQEAAMPRQEFAHRSKQRPGIENETHESSNVEPRSTAASRLRAKRKIDVDDDFGRAEDYDIPARSPYFPQETRKSSRQPKPTRTQTPTPPPPERWSHVNKLPAWAHPVMYPPEGLRRVAVDFQDLERLDEGEFLNDNLIAFALRRIEENMAPELKDSVHFFNSFFYTSLTGKNTSRRGFNYDAVSRWTKGKDLFGCPYIVMPINIDLHWFVAIICNLPNLSRRAAGLEDEDDDEDSEQVADMQDEDHEADAALATDNVVVSSAATGGNVQDPSQTMKQLTLADGGRHADAEAEEDESADGSRPSSAVQPAPTSSSRRSTASSGKSKKKKKGRPSLPKRDPDIPAILICDSFGSSHPPEVRQIKDYLSCEADAKRSMTLDIKQLQGVTAKGIPHQTNFCDCGVYVVGYVEEFAKDPRKFASKVLQSEMKENDFADFDASEKRAEIRAELLKLHEQQEAERKAKKSLKKTAAKVGVDSASAAATSHAAEVKTIEDSAKGTVAERAIHPATVQPPTAPQRVLQPQSANNLNGRHLSKPPTEEDDLELAVPRAFQHSDVGNTRSKPVSAPPTSSQESAATGKEDEMLDNCPSRTEEVDQTQLNGEDDAIDNDPSRALIEELEHAAAESRSEGHRAPHASAEMTLAGGVSTADNVRLPKSADGTNEHPVEIQDSQEQSARVSQRLPSRKHTKFAG